MPRHRKLNILAFIALILVLCGFVVVRVMTPALQVAVVVPPVVTPPQPPVATTSTHEVIGLSVENRAIDAYTYGSGTTTLVFVGGMHGGYEWNSVLLAYQFMDYLTDHPDAVPANEKIIIIPAANPDGLYKVTGKVGRFSTSDIVNVSMKPEGYGRFNAHDVDLNRNFGCHFVTKSMWKSHTVSAGTKAFSEPESAALRDFFLAHHPKSVVFWHSQANAVYASECDKGVLPGTLALMNAYAKATGYPAVKSFDAYKVTGDSEGWLASQGVPAVTVELKTHESVEWDRNLLGIKALLDLYREKKQP